MSYKIETVQLVEWGHDRYNSQDRTNLKYPWPNMKKGDSFYIPGYSAKKQSNIHTVGNNWFMRNNPDGKIITRREGDGIRVYRNE